MKNTCVHIYTGTGKGKTTSAAGCALRALGQGYKVAIFQFLKGKGPESGETKALKKFRNCKVTRFKQIHPCFQKTKTVSKALKQQVEKDFIKTGKEIHSKKYDLVILDEILIAVRDGYILETDLIDLIETKPASTEFILTGRGATKNLLKWADYATGMQEIKHPYCKFRPPRKGIEY